MQLSNDFTQITFTVNVATLVSSMIDICGFVMLLVISYYIIFKSKHNKLPSAPSKIVSKTVTKIVTNDKFILIGITGRKKSGKDTIGKYLIDNHGFVRVAFADALKEACKIIFGFTDEQLYDDELKEIIDKYWNHTPREILQKVGTELFRIELPLLCEHINNDIWIRSVDRKIEQLREKGHTRIAITDVRFDNELEYISHMKGYSWKVSRPSLLKNVDPNLIVHSSEALIDNFVCNEHFVNEGTLDQLYESVETKINNILTKPTLII